MHRFYAAKPPSGNSVIIDDARQVHHIREVLRLKTGEAVAVFDGTGNEYLGTIEKTDKQQVCIGVTERKPAAVRPVRITIACAVPKQTRMDDIVDKLTQLGVDAIIPLETERVIVKLDERHKAAKLHRWQKIAQSATEQSQRGAIPLIEPVTAIGDVLRRAADYDLKLIPTLAGEKKHLRDILAESKPKNIIVLIGPEGDFTPEEVAQAQKAGFIPVSLGKSVLRVDTAAIAVASYISLAIT
ncbi:MAG: 16S rRNA (uracil(1498)-N(3))-methyltransferase [Dehalococcoidales bacterium]|nr:16S rRNA (uracil(1498)-N(3))-methyltransferase [Dehalococcoidales bacterium]